MYPEAFIIWITSNRIFYLDGTFYDWPEHEKEEVPIANTVEELYQIYLERK